MERAKVLLLGAGALDRLEISGKINEVLDFFGGVVHERKQRPVLEIESHDAYVSIFDVNALRAVREGYNGRLPAAFSLLRNFASVEGSGTCSAPKSIPRNTFIA